MSFVSLSSAAYITFSNASSEKRERRETKLAKVGVTLWKGNSGSSLEMTTLKALKSWSSHDLPWPSHETLFFHAHNLTWTALASWRNQTCVYRELCPTAQVVCISILTTIHKTIHVQPGSIPGVHRKASEPRIWDCELVSKRLQTRNQLRRQQVLNVPFCMQTV